MKNEHHGHSLSLQHIRNAINQYPQLPLSKRDTLIKWKKKVKEIPIPDFIPYEFLYSMTIGLPTGIFSYQFDTPQIISFLNNEEIMPIQLDVDSLISFYDQPYWEEHPDDTPYPPVMLETPLMPKGYLLIGHKTVLEAKKQGQKIINVYCLSEMEFVPLMYDNLSKVTYGFHRDLQNLLATPHSLPSNSLFISHIEKALSSS